MAPTQHCEVVPTCQDHTCTSVLNESSSSFSKTFSSSTASDSSTSSSASKTTSTNSNSIKKSEDPAASTGLLPIFSRGLFFQDQYFQDARQNFEAAVKDVLQHFGHPSTDMDDLTSYRNLRRLHLTDENQAVTVTNNDHHHQVVLDVREFDAGNVSVKVVDENELVVEGRMEQQDPATSSCQSFRRTFCFPGLVIPEAVTCTRSSDGILTITVPKKIKPHVTGKTTASDFVTFTSSTNCQDNQQLPFTSINVSADQNASLSNTSDSCCSQKESASTMHSSESSSHTAISQQLSSSSNSSKNTTSSQQTTCQATASDAKSAVEAAAHTTEEEPSTQKLEPPSTLVDFMLPISQKGLFFHDDFFLDARQHFESAVSEVLARFGHAGALDEDLSLYRSLRESDLTDQSQAIKVSHDQHSHQVVLDVRHFVEGQLQVKVVGSRQVQVEGKVEQRQGHTTSTKSFCQVFPLPEDADMEAVTSALSADGVLTIRAPRVARALRDIPISRKE